MRRLVVGDIHGNYKGLIQVLERSNFDNEKDLLISLGDIVDGHSDSFNVVERLLQIKRLVKIKGNHDDWFHEWLKTGIHPAGWHQGAKATGESYLKNSRPDESWYSYKETPEGVTVLIETIKRNDIPDSHIEFFENQLPYYRDCDNNLFIHGGFNKNFLLEDQMHQTFWWDRDLWKQAMLWEEFKEIGHEFDMKEDFKEVFIGHTSTQFFNSNVPMHCANIWNMDTGGGWHGYVTIMDIDTKEFWQSDDGKSLYPDFKGR